MTAKPAKKAKKKKVKGKSFKDLVIDKKYIRAKYDLEAYRELKRKKVYLSIEYESGNIWCTDEGIVEMGAMDAISIISNTIMSEAAKGMMWALNAA